MAKKKNTKPAPKGKPAAKAKPAPKAKPAEKPKAAKAKPAEKAKPAKVQAPPTARPAATVQTPPEPKPAPAPAPAPAPKPAAGAPQWLPAGKQAIIPHLVVRGAAHAIDFCKRAFGAEEKLRMPSPDGYSIGHAEVAINGSALYLCDENPDWGSKAPQTVGGSPTTIHLYVEDVDATFKKALEAGAIAVAPPTDMFWGDRFAKLRDPFGHQWSLATHKEDLSLEEIGRRAEEAMKKLARPDDEDEDEEDHEEAE